MSEIDDTNPAQLIKIQMLGGFTLETGGFSISDNTNRAHQLWNLLEYLVAFRRREITQEELIGILWEEEGSENPANALKNLVYRIRMVLSGAGIPCARELIASKRGVYTLAGGFVYEIDTERFEELCQRASQEALSDDDRIQAYREALGLYRGDFLPQSSSEQWVVPLNVYYHNLYVKSVGEVVALLGRQGSYQTIVDICQRATMVDQFEEQIHQSLIRALIKLGQQSKAMNHYEYVTNLFYRELGVKPSEDLRTLYRDIIKTVNHVEKDLEVIKEDLRESSTAEGAFCCEYEVFKNMYRLEARSAARSGQTMFLALLTVTDGNDAVPEVKVLTGAMERLLRIVKAGLRRGDVISRFSATQYVLLLPTHTLENGQMVLDRIVLTFKKDRRNGGIGLYPKLEPLEPVY